MASLCGALGVAIDVSERVAIKAYSWPVGFYRHEHSYRWSPAIRRLGVLGASGDLEGGTARDGCASVLAVPCCQIEGSSDVRTCGIGRSAAANRDDCGYGHQAAPNAHH